MQIQQITSFFREMHQILLQVKRNQQQNRQNQWHKEYRSKFFRFVVFFYFWQLDRSFLSSRCPCRCTITSNSEFVQGCHRGNCENDDFRYETFITRHIWNRTTSKTGSEFEFVAIFNIKLRKFPHRFKTVSNRCVQWHSNTFRDKRIRVEISHALQSTSCHSLLRYCCWEFMKTCICVCFECAKVLVRKYVSCLLRLSSLGWFRKRSKVIYIRF